MPLFEKNMAVEIGSKIRLLRIRRSQTLQAASSYTGLSTLVLSQIEAGNYCVFIGKFPQFLEFANMYAQYFDCSINECLDPHFQQPPMVNITNEPSIPYFLRKKNDEG